MKKHIFIKRSILIFFELFLVKNLIHADAIYLKDKNVFSGITTPGEAATQVKIIQAFIHKENIKEMRFLSEEKPDFFYLIETTSGASITAKMEQLVDQGIRIFGNAYLGTEGKILNKNEITKIIRLKKVEIITFNGEKFSGYLRSEEGKYNLIEKVFIPESPISVENSAIAKTEKNIFDLASIAKYYDENPPPKEEQKPKTIGHQGLEYAIYLSSNYNFLNLNYSQFISHSLGIHVQGTINIFSLLGLRKNFVPALLLYGSWQNFGHINASGSGSEIGGGFLWKIFLFSPLNQHMMVSAVTGFTNFKIDTIDFSGYHRHFSANLNLLYAVKVFTVRFFVGINGSYLYSSLSYLSSGITLGAGYEF